jgi:hypothetical protein
LFHYGGTVKVFPGCSSQRADGVHTTEAARRLNLTSHFEQGIDLGYQRQERFRVLLNCGLAAKLIPAFFCLIFRTATSRGSLIMALRTNKG